MAEQTTAMRLLAEATGVDLGAVPHDARIGAFEQWDSLAHLRLLLAIEQRMGRELDAEEVARIADLEDVAAILGGSQAGNGAAR